MRVAAEGGAEDDLLLTNFAPEEVLVSLYQAAHLFVFPSYYEGFGLPLAEAMACGAPVIASAVSSMPELVRQPQALFNPHDPPAVTDILLRGATDPAFRALLRRSGEGASQRFAWQRVAEATLEAYRRTGEGLRPARRTRPRVAIVTPYPPELSGVAVYSANLIGFLSEWCDVDCFVRGEPRAYATPLHSRTRLFPASTLEGRNELVRYDRIVYCMGNSDHHEFVLRALERLPGDVLTHDVRLVRFYEWRSGTGGPALAETLSSMYGRRLPPELEGALALRTDEARRLGVWMMGDVIRLADRVLVHSSFARDVVRLEAEAAGEAVEVLTLPFGFPTPPPGPSRLRFPAFAPAIVSFGLVDAVKGVDALVGAMAAVLERHPRATLTLVGPVNDIERARVMELAQAAGVEERVTLTGTVDHAAYTGWLRRADVAVQLREVAQGEASLTVAETMAYGVPTIVTRVGWMAELPDEAVAMVELGADAGEVAAAILGLLDDPDRWRALGEAGARHARDTNFAWAAEALYRAILEPEDRPAAHPRLRAGAA
jgi:glycosyltransferase involved in cell wall biosynthesis